MGSPIGEGGGLLQVRESLTDVVRNLAPLVSGSAKFLLSFLVNFHNRDNSA